jgi:hypothetical protein
MGTDSVMVKAHQAGLIQDLNEWRWTAFTALGVIFASLIAVLLRQDDWKENLARFIGAMVMGLLGSQLFIMAHPNLAALSNNPIIMVGLGFGNGLFGFAAVKAFFWWVMKRAPEEAIGRAEDWLHRTRKNTRDNGQEADE